MEVIRVTSEEMEHIPYVREYAVMPEIPAMVYEGDCVVDYPPIERISEEVQQYVYYGGQEWRKLFLHGNSHIELMQFVEALHKNRAFWKRQCETDVKEFVQGLQNMLQITTQLNKKQKNPQEGAWSKCSWIYLSHKRTGIVNRIIY